MTPRKGRREGSGLDMGATLFVELGLRARSVYSVAIDA
jgi:hypothetical protein